MSVFTPDSSTRPRAPRVDAGRDFSLALSVKFVPVAWSRSVKLRGFLTVAVIGGVLIAGDPFQRVVVAGLGRLLPGRKLAILTWWERFLANYILWAARVVGGAHIASPPALPGREGVLVLMNHQSVLDIPLVVAALQPLHPRIITRARYSRGKPLISHMTRLYQYPVVEPRANARTQITALAENARTSPVPMMIFPEGTRTRNGEIGQWKEGGLRGILGARKWMVYLLVVDGYWESARLVDFMENVSTIEGRAVALGPFDGPEPGADPERFIAEMRERMIRALASLRAGAPAA
ncbi:MAG: 1-acyl-sn-glycerol-3-phosphate acyltransferase [Gemmatimonadetes bacterium]|nr:1-acyl-sn-glycerol-3-phosphate acyltransferase [Gemmatimonadota bacterium]